MRVETFKAKGLELSTVFRVQVDNLQKLKRKSSIFSDFTKECKGITRPQKEA